MNKKALPNIKLSSSKGFLAISTLALACTLTLPAQAVTLGHARIVQNQGHAFDVQIPIKDLSGSDDNILAAQIAPLEQWSANGLKPPVDLDSLRVYVQKTDQGTSQLRVVSEQSFNDPIVDLLLYVKTASGFDPFQVSIVAPASKQVTKSGSSASTSENTSSAAAGTAATDDVIEVKSGDNMFAIANRNAVQGVSVYQLMIALQKTNPEAFIKDNINLVRAGAKLKVPSIDEMLSISDAQARQQFVAQTQALSSSASSSDAVAGTSGSSNQGNISYDDSVTEPPISKTQKDVVKLGDASSDQADNDTAQQHALKEAKVRVSQLENNVKNLNQALQSQGQAASSAVTDSAKAINDSLNQLTDSLLGDDITGEQGNGLLADNLADSASGSSSTSQDFDAASSNGATAASSQSEDSAGNTTTNADDNSKSGINVPVKESAGKQQSSVSESVNNESGQATDASATAQSHINSESSWVAWIQNHLFGFASSVLALIVLLLVWFLRRLNNKTDEKQPLVTKEMLDSKLSEINLELDSDDTPK